MLRNSLNNKNEQKNNSDNHNNFISFLTSWELNYNNNILNIPLFNNLLTSQWSNEQKQLFVKIFFHVRGHFHNFLWYMGNFSSKKEFKDIVLHNIEEEFGKNGLSHERLYIEFAKSLGVDIKSEFLLQEHYPKFAKDFNYGHLEWLNNHTENSRLAAFSAYERLDNVDYKNLLNLVRGLIDNKRGLTFFEVHARANHFDETTKYLDNIWNQSSETVIEAFEFIANHQLHMWENLSDAIFSYRESC